MNIHLLDKNLDICKTQKFILMVIVKIGVTLSRAVFQLLSGSTFSLKLSLPLNNPVS